MSKSKNEQQDVVLYIGHRSNPFICPNCGRMIVKGFIRQKENKSACSKHCIETILRSDKNV